MGIKMDITMKEVREEIDLLDKELVLLLARRQKCIEMAAFVKRDKEWGKDTTIKVDGNYDVVVDNFFELKEFLNC